MRLPPASLRDRDVLLLSGIGNPGAFRATVSALGGRIRKVWVYPDHHRFTAGDIQRVRTECLQFPDALPVTTEKDAARLLFPGTAQAVEGFPLWVLKVRIRMEDEGSWRAWIREQISGWVLRVSPGRTKTIEGLR
jgi:tetraacyldisaccharide 4'-kinase